jgi:hypothetical protein
MEASVFEKDMQARDDARTLAEAKKIEADQPRKQAAMAAAETLGREAVGEAQKLNEVAKGFYPRQVEHQEREKKAAGVQQ